MKSIDVLRSEHCDLESMLAVLEGTVSRLRGGGTVSADLVLSTIAFFESFGQNSHHAKEELVFPPLAQRYGLKRETGFVNAIRAQHDIDRAYLLEAREGALRLGAHEPAAASRLAVVLQEYVDLAKEHLRIEEAYFDRVTAEPVSPADDARLVKQFEALDRQRADLAGGRHCA